MDAETILSVEEMHTQIFTDNGTVHAVTGLSYEVKAGEVLAIVGESGCGKSMGALSVMRLLPPFARITSGRVLFRGTDLASAGKADMQRIRGRDIAMIFQEPMTSLNPVMSLSDQLCEPLRQHLKLGRKAARERAIELLAFVGISDPAERARQFPHELSGGMRQRVMIAMALACDPKLLIADEPTTALDVTVQAQVLELIGELRARLGTAVVLITHDLGVVAGTADRVLVMYAGRKVEEAPVRELFAQPRHPYTRGLLAAMPRLGATLGVFEPEPLAEIPGMVAPLDGSVSGCPFAPRCSFVVARCLQEMPPLEGAPGAPEHITACFEQARVAEAER
ncbi:ABC transporter ATP-binding protein [soil metagenome]